MVSRPYQIINQEYGWDFQNFSTRTLAEGAMKRMSKKYKRVEIEVEKVIQTDGRTFNIFKVWFKEV